MALSTPQDSLIVGGAMVASVVVREESDTILSSWPIAWSSTDSTRAVVSHDGLITAVRPGLVGVVATTDSGTPVADTVQLRMLPRVASVSIFPRYATMIISRSQQLTAIVRDSTGAVLSGRPVQWGSAGAGSITQDGLLQATEGGSLLVTVSVENQLDSNRVNTLIDSRFTAISAGDRHTCALTLSGRAYCWGNSSAGQAGDPTIAHALGPHPIDTLLRFHWIRASGSHTCGTTTALEIYCWGFNSYGQVGTAIDRDCGVGCRAVDTPTLVPLPPAQVFAGFEHSCAAIMLAEIWCWGANLYGQLGRGTADSSFNPIPDSVRTSGGTSEIVGGFAHTCTIAAGGVAQCWGGNTVGQLGLGTMDSVPHALPAPILGNLQFMSLTAGQAHTCGVTVALEGWCWGQATDGKLGTGYFSTVEPAPVLISGGLSWFWLSANAEHTCGITQGFQLYCWGNGNPTPTPVDPSLYWAHIAAGHYHTCAITDAGVAYCWGDGLDGKLGTGDQQSSSFPVKVAGQN